MLERYEVINHNKALAKFQIAKQIDAEEAREGNLEERLKIHSELKCEFKRALRMRAKEKPAGYSFLHLKKDILMEMLKSCIFCERRCMANRYERRGFCGCGIESYYSSEFLHMGEEQELILSHTIFFNRCTFRCVFCQNYSIVYSDDMPVDTKEMAAIIDRRRGQGSRNINFVGGNPDQHAHTILDILIHVNSNVPVVWNSNMYHSDEFAEIIEDVVDVWLGDFKYGNNDCAIRHSNVPDYWEIVTRNFLRAKDNGELLIRHLVLPAHLECCTARVVDWVSRNLEDERFNLMFQYYPCYKAFEHPEIARRLSSEEIKRAKEMGA